MSYIFIALVTLIAAGIFMDYFVIAAVIVVGFGLLIDMIG